MLAHRQSLLIPRLTGRDNYKDWSRKMELKLRCRKLWFVVLTPPKPIETLTSHRIFVASKNRIYKQCPNIVVSAVHK